MLPTATTLPSARSSFYLRIPRQLYASEGFEQSCLVLSCHVRPLWLMTTPLAGHYRLDRGLSPRSLFIPGNPRLPPYLYTYIYTYSPSSCPSNAPLHHSIFESRQHHFLHFPHRPNARSSSIRSRQSATHIRTNIFVRLRIVSHMKTRAPTAPSVLPSEKSLDNQQWRKQGRADLSCLDLTNVGFGKRGYA